VNARNSSGEDSGTLNLAEDVMAGCWLLLLVKDAEAGSQLLSPGGS